MLVTDHLSDGPLGTSTVIGSLHEPDKGPTLFEGAQSSIKKQGSIHLQSLISKELSVSWRRNSNKLSSPTTSEWKPIQRKTGSTRMDLMGARKVKDGTTRGGITRPGLTRSVIGTHLILTLINLFR